MMSLEEFTFAPLAEMPTEQDLAGTQRLMPVLVIMYTYVDTHTGKPKFIREQFRDPETGQDKIVWSRVTDSLAYVQQTKQ